MDTGIIYWNHNSKFQVQSVGPTVFSTSILIIIIITLF